MNQQLTAEQRRNIVRAAQEWIGTPYHHHGRVKKAGADCAMFPLTVYQECGVLPTEYQPPEYSVQWHLHRSEELYLKEIDKFVREISGPPQPAVSLADAVQSAHEEGQEFGGSVAREAPALWLEAVLARKPRIHAALPAASPGARPRCERPACRARRPRPRP